MTNSLPPILQQDAERFDIAFSYRRAVMENRRSPFLTSDDSDYRKPK